MGLRKRIYEAVTTAATGIPDGSVFSPGATGKAVAGDSPSRPFIVIRFQPEQPGVLPRFPVTQRRWNAWVHDDQGTMDNIDLAVDALKKEIPTLLFGDGDGVRIIETVWEGVFADGYDDHYGTTVTYVDFMTTYRAIP